MIRTNFYFPEKMLERLKQLAARTGLPVSELIRRAVDVMLSQEKV